MGLAVLILILLVFRGVSHLVLRHDLLVQMEDSEVACQAVADDDFALEKFVAFGLGHLERLRLVHVMRADPGDPSTEIRDPLLRPHIVVIQHLSVVVHY